MEIIVAILALAAFVALVVFVVRSPSDTGTGSPGPTRPVDPTGRPTDLP